MKPQVEVTQGKVCPTPPKADELKLRPVRPTPVTDATGKTWVCVSPNDYENTAENTADILSFIRQQNAIIDYYKSCVQNE